MVGAALASHAHPDPEKLRYDSPDSNSTTRSGPVAARGPLLVTVMTEVTLDPCATGFGDLVLVIRKSAPSGLTCTLTEPELFPGFGSLVAEVIVAVLVNVVPEAEIRPLGGAVAMTVMSSVADVGKLARVQVTVLLLLPQAQFGPFAETKVQPAGKASVTTALTAVAGPLLRGWIRNVTLLPAIAGVPDSTSFCAMRTSAPGTTVVSAVAVLSDVSGSAMPPTAGSTVALLVIVPPAALTVPTTVTAGMAAPTACGPARLQVTTPAAWLQLQSDPDADTKATAGGRLSVITIAPDALGPALLAVSV